MIKKVLAFDIGASSGRVILGIYDHGKITTQELHRFSNAAVEIEGTLYWEFGRILDEILKGLELALENHTIDSIGFDTWGVDFIAFDSKGEILQNPISYRDKRTQGMMDFMVEQFMAAQTLFEKTGNQPQEINTLFQLLAFKKEQPDYYKKTTMILTLPDALNYLLTGVKKTEVSIASTTQLMNPKQKVWEKSLFEKLDLKAELLPEIISEGNILGKIKSKYTAQDISVVNVCEHDTASAVVCVPAEEEEFLFVSCGTWSIVGTELREPVLSEAVYLAGLTNESGQGNTTRLMKNCTGLWILQELRKELNAQGLNYSFDKMAEEAEEALAFQFRLDTEEERFVSPGKMLDKLKSYAAETQQTFPNTNGALFRSIYEGLAFNYKTAIQEIEKITKKSYSTVYIVGGGSQAKLLCQIVANVCERKVVAGPAEASALGNIAVQLKVHGIFEDVADIRRWIRNSDLLTDYIPDAEL